MNKKWYETSYRRNLVDMHIDEWSEEFLSQFDPQKYFECLKKGNIQSPMIYLNSHVGLCNWDSESAKVHESFKGNNKIKILIDLCHEDGMDVIGYYSLIFNNWAYDKHPNWRIIDKYGKPSRNDASQGFMYGGRYGLVCPNSMDYRVFLKKQFSELLNTYKIEGIFLDMTFWPKVCYCDNCKKRFKQEEGFDLPQDLDWANPIWNKFQRKREQWMSEFASFCSAELKRLQPDISIEHQLATILTNWVRGVNEGVNDASDYAGGDLYGGHYQESFICKLYYEITNNQPFEYMTSRCDPGLLDHTTTKSIEALKLHNYLTLAHHGAFLVIDAIDPKGTLNANAYNVIGQMFEESIPYEKYLKGHMQTDTAIYFDLKSKMDSQSKEQPEAIPNPQLDAAVGAAIALSNNHFLFTVIPSNKQEKIRDKKVVTISEASFLSDEEIKEFVDYVKTGGNLYISGSTNLKLANTLLGLEFEGYTKENVTYIAPTPEGQHIFGEMYTNDYPLSFQSAQMKVKNPLRKKVLATTTLPYTNPDDITIYSSIHSNPPGIKTDFPALIYGEYGMGKVIWSAASFEKNPQKAHKDVFSNIIDALYCDSRTIITTAPNFVQFTIFDDASASTKYFHCVNVQENIPLIKINDFHVKLKFAKSIKSIKQLPTEDIVDFFYNNGYLEFDVENIEIFKMYQINY